uniref:Uncharacterized protein AlNc14C267G9911 n=1 Tax=Albugo laibachii Nc14 TaxID=890382 RepID=F0WU90_9STRA|nr:conserved hypothetical protein [Albugo laibachii Nc14]|eukprot:CCA24968.1 conserved hypothetical protein [Albugo laibachii Nc14]
MSQQMQSATSLQAIASLRPLLKHTSIDTLLSHSIFQFRLIPSTKSAAIAHFQTRICELQHRLQLARSIHSPTLSFFLEIVGDLEQLLDAEHEQLNLIFSTPLRHFRRQLEFAWQLDTQSIHEDAPLQAALHIPHNDVEQRNCQCKSTCQICFHDSGDPLIKCATCKVALHLHCYRVSGVFFADETRWKCHSCRSEASSDTTSSASNRICQACFQVGGALVPTSTPSEWVHMSCALHLEPLTLEMQLHGPSGKPQHIVSGVKDLEASRNLRCYFCKNQNKGACASCAYDACETAYHIPCALQNGIRFMTDRFASSSVSGCILHQVQVLTSISTRAESAEPALSDWNRLTSSLNASIFQPIDHKSMDNVRMVLISSLPLELALIETSFKIHHRSIRAFGLCQTPSNSVAKAMETGILHQNDILLAINDKLCIDQDTDTVDKILSECKSVPVRCWFLQKPSIDLVKIPAPKPESPAIASLPKTVTSLLVEKEETATRKRLFSTSFNDDLKELNWPWACYLRSDGKLAMNMVWKSIEMACFHEAVSTRSKWNALGLRLNCLLGIAFFSFDSSRAYHEEFGSFQSLSSLLRVPSPPEKAASGILSEALLLRHRKDDEFAEVDPLVPGTTVTVVKRTWPGINKLGGTGRIRKHHCERANGSEKSVYSYDVTYVLGGREKRIARKYIKLLDQSSESEAPESHPIDSIQTTASTFHLILQKEASEWIPRAMELHRSDRKLQLRFSAVDERLRVIDLNSNEQVVSTLAECFCLPEFPLRSEATSDDAISQRLARFQAKLSVVSSAIKNTLMRLQDAISKEFRDSMNENAVYLEQRVASLQAAHYKDLYRDLASLQPDPFPLSKSPKAQAIDCSFGVFVNTIREEDGEPCVLCELTGGDLASTAQDDVVHPQCAMYTPETFFQNAKVFGIDKVPIRDRLALVHFTSDARWCMVT